MEMLIVILTVGLICIVSYLRAIHISLQRIIEKMSNEK